MSDVSYRPLNLGNTSDDDPQVLDSLVQSEATPPTPIVEPIVTPVLSEPRIPTRLLSVRQMVDPSWSQPTLLLPEDTRRKFLTLSVSDPTELTPRMINPPNPGVGVGSIDVTVPSGEYWELISARFIITTSAAVGGRVPLINIVSPDGVNYLTVSSGISYTTVSSNRTFNWWVGGICSNGSDNLGGNGLPQNLILPPGTIVRPTVGGMDVGDAISSVNIVYRKVSTDSGVVVRSDSGSPTGLAYIQAGKTIRLDNHTGSLRAIAVGSSPVSIDVWSVTE